MAWTKEYEEAVRLQRQEREQYFKDLEAEKAREWATMPAQVLEVHNAMLANAKKAYPDEKDDEVIRLTYTRAEKKRDGHKNIPTGAWIVGSNHEDGSAEMVWQNGVWQYESTRTGARWPMEGGHEEALANASIFWTG